MLVGSEPISAEVRASALIAIGLPTTAADALQEYKRLLLSDAIELTGHREL